MKSKRIRKSKRNNHYKKTQTRTRKYKKSQTQTRKANHYKKSKRELKKVKTRKRTGGDTEMVELKDVSGVKDEEEEKERVRELIDIFTNATPTILRNATGWGWKPVIVWINAGNEFLKKIVFTDNRQISPYINYSQISRYIEKLNDIMKLVIETYNNNPEEITLIYNYTKNNSSSSPESVKRMLNKDIREKILDPLINQATKIISFKDQYAMWKGNSDSLATTKENKVTLESIENNLTELNNFYDTLMPHAVKTKSKENASQLMPLERGPAANFQPVRTEVNLDELLPTITMQDRATFLTKTLPAKYGFNSDVASIVGENT